jgi:hypothetical protein
LSGGHEELTQLKGDLYENVFQDMNTVFRVTDTGGGLCFPLTTDVYVGEEGPWTGVFSNARNAYTAIERQLNYPMEVEYWDWGGRP